MEQEVANDSEPEDRRESSGHNDVEGGFLITRYTISEVYRSFGSLIESIGAMVAVER